MFATVIPFFLPVSVDNVVTARAVEISRDSGGVKPVIVEASNVHVCEEEEDIELPRSSSRPTNLDNRGSYVYIQHEGLPPFSSLDRTLLAVCVLSLAAIAIGVASSIFIGASYQIACIAINIFKIVTIICRSNRPGVTPPTFTRGSVATGLSCLDLIFAAVYFHNVFGIVACMKYAFSASSDVPDFTGDQDYYLETANCAESSSQLFWNCYCYNKSTDNCITADATTHSDSNSADEACGNIVDHVPSLALALLVLSVIQLSSFLIITVIAKRNDRPNHI